MIKITKNKSVKIKNKVVGKGDNKFIMKNIRRWNTKKTGKKYVYFWDLHKVHGNTNPIINDNADAKNIAGAIREVKKRLKGKSRHGYMNF